MRLLSIVADSVGIPVGRAVARPTETHQDQDEHSELHSCSMIVKSSRRQCRDPSTTSFGKATRRRRLIAYKQTSGLPRPTPNFVRPVRIPSIYAVSTLLSKCGLSPESFLASRSIGREGVMDRYETGSTPAAPGHLDGGPVGHCHC